MDRLEERRLSAAIVAASVALFLALFAIHGPSFETPDEAKYIGLGLNILAGRGLVTDFGAQFLNHPPLWPLVLAAPRAWLGLDALTVGHLLDALAGAALIALAAALAWRVRPAAGAVTSVALLATTYLASLSRTAGIDLPAAVCALAYLLVASRAIDRGSVRLGLLAGMLFGLGFLTKETVLPFAPIPFLVALLGPARGTTVARIGAAALLAATVVCGWWFVLYASLVGTVYRLGGPAWLLVPVGLADVGLIVLGLVQPRIPASGGLRQVFDRAAAPRSIDRVRAVVAWGGIAAWLLGQFLVYARAAKLGGASILRASQLADDVRVYLPQLGLVVGFAVAGSLLALACARRSQAVRELAAGAVAQVPLILLVLGIGETPRHYIAAIALAAGLGAAGWVAAAGVASDRRARIGIVGAAAVAFALATPQLVKASRVAAVAVIGLAVVIALVFVARPRLPTLARPIRVAGVRVGSAVLALSLAFVGGAGIASAGAYWVTRSTPAGVAEAQAVDEVGAWLRANLPAGATIMVGPGLGYDLALAVHDHQQVVRYRPESASLRAGAPYGLAAGGDPVVQPVTLEAALHNVDLVDVYEADALAARIRAVRPAAWVEAVYVDAAAPANPVLAMFDAATGSARLETWTFAYGSRQLVVVAYSLDPDRFAAPDGVIYADPAAIEVVARLLREAGDAAAAARYLDRLQPTPAGATADSAMAALRAVAGR